MYKEALDLYAGNAPTLLRAFAAGFVSGQAEKVYLGACRAAMFRPSQDRAGLIADLLADVCRRYGLWFILDVGSKKEAWICRPSTMNDVLELKDIEEDTVEWHLARAWLCGVPVNEVDIEFHKRVGAGERCD
jgi:hypothetical protein